MNTFRSFLHGRVKVSMTNLECIARIVTKDHNERLTSQPTMNELQELLFSTNPNSA